MLYWKDDNFLLGQLIEHASQIIFPVLLYGILTKRISERAFIALAKIGIVFTFFGHALYAIGYYRVLSSFMDMCINFFGFSEEASGKFLFIVGIADIAVCVLIFIPRLARIAPAYAVFWGFVTALARVLVNINPDIFWFSLNQTWFETLYRLSHGSLPLILRMMMRKVSINEIFKIRSAVVDVWEKKPS